MEQACGAPVTIVSCGPSYADKLIWDAQTARWVAGIQPATVVERVPPLATNDVDQLAALRAELESTKAELARLKASKGKA